MNSITKINGIIKLVKIFICILYILYRYSTATICARNFLCIQIYYSEIHYFIYIYYMQNQRTQNILGYFLISSEIIFLMTQRTTDRSKTRNKYLLPNSYPPLRWMISFTKCLWYYLYKNDQIFPNLKRRYRTLFLSKYA